MSYKTADELFILIEGSANHLVHDYERDNFKNIIELDPVETITRDDPYKNNTIISFTVYEIKTIWIKNLRINIRPELVDFIDFNIGGQRIDRIYYQFYDVFVKEFFPDQDQIPDDFFIVPCNYFINGIPTLRLHEMKLIIHLKEKISEKISETVRFRYDTFKNKNHLIDNDINDINDAINNRPDKFKPVTHIFFQSQLQKEEPESFKLNNELTSLMLYFNHPVNMLFIDGDICPDILEFVFDLYNFKCPLTYKLGSIHVYKFGNFINFSRIDNARLLLLYPVRSINAIGIQSMRFMNGMAGMEYSK